MRRRPANTFTAVADLWMAINTVIFIMFVFAVMAMALKVQADAGVKPKAEYMILAEWDLQHDADVDLYVRDPNGNIVNFQHREAGAMSLDHDSRGSMSDTHHNADGSTSQPRAYVEVVTLRGIVAGEYTVNLHLYGVRDDGVIQHSQGRPYEVPVAVKIVRLNPQVETEYDQTTTLEKVWEEKTCTRFTLAADGAWLGADPTPMRLIQ